MRYPLSVLTVHLGENSPGIEHYKAMLDDFSELFGMILHLEGNLFRYPHLKEFFEQCKSRDISNIGVRVNSLSLSEAKFFSKNKVRAVLFSFYSTDQVVHDRYAGDGSYDTLIEGIGICKAMNIPFEISWIISQKTLAELEKFISFASNHNASLLNINRPLFHFEHSDKDFYDLENTEYANVLKKIKSVNDSGNYEFRISFSHTPHKILLEPSSAKKYSSLGGCSGGIISAEILDLGDVIICYPLRDISLGNIGTDRLIDIWENNDTLKKLRTREANLKGKCKECEYIHLCGGCRAVSFIKNNDLFGEDTSCFK